MSTFSDIYESLFGNLGGQADEQDLQNLRQIQDLYGKSGQVFSQGGTEYDKLDPATRAAQMQALRQMQDIASQGGLTAVDRSRLDQINRQANQQEQSARQAIIQQQQARGALGGGAALAAQMMAQQGAAERRAQGGLNTAAEAQQRALQAIQSGAGMAGNIRQQDAQRAAAQDAINQFNTRQQESGLNRQLNMGTQRYNAQQAAAQRLRDKQKRGEEAFGGLLSGAAKIGSSAMTGGFTGALGALGGK